jgi:hypothetical protein
MINQKQRSAKGLHARKSAVPRFAVEALFLQYLVEKLALFRQHLSRPCAWPTPPPRRVLSITQTPNWLRSAPRLFQRQVILELC